MLLETLESWTQYLLNYFDGYIPPGDIETFILNYNLAGVTVAIDAIILLIVLLPLLPKKTWLPIITLITLTHALAGYAGLGLMLFGAGTGIGIWAILIFSFWMCGHFIVKGMTDDDGEDPSDIAKKLASGLFTFAAFSLFYSVSNDEFFAVLQRYQWMGAQEWDSMAMAVNIGLSMVVLQLIQMGIALSLIVFKPLTNLVTRHGDHAMFFVFSYIMYFMVRGFWQNGLGFEPYELGWTGIAPTLLTVGIILTWLLQKALRNEVFATNVKKFFFVKDEPDLDEVTETV